MAVNDPNGFANLVEASNKGLAKPKKKVVENVVVLQQAPKKN
jgi:hypothetical protein